MFFESAQCHYLAQCNSTKLVANKLKICHEACIEMQNNVTIVYGYWLWERIMMITCIIFELWVILFLLHDASHIDLQQLHAWFLSLDNSQAELGLESFWPQNTSTVLHGFIHSHITFSDLVDNNAVLLYSQLNGLLTTLGPHLVRYIYASLNICVMAFSSRGWYHIKRHNI